MTPESLVQEDPAGSKLENGNADSRRRILLAAVLIVTALAYAETLRYEFVFDDTEQILQNPMVQSWHEVPRLFTHHVWADVYPTSPQNYYRPVFLLWLLVHYKIFGQNPMGWHLTAVALHLLVTLLVYLLARRLVKDSMGAVIAALIFGLHPIHIESVAWISGVTDPLLAVFSIPAFLYYLNNRDPDSKMRRAVSLSWSLVLYSLALLCKETAVVLPMILFAYEFVSPSDKTRSEIDQLPSGNQATLRVFVKRSVASARCVLPYLAVTVVYIAIRAAVLKGFGHSMVSLSKSTIILTWPSLLWFYVKELFWPVGLSVFYDLEYVTTPGISNFFLPLLALAAICGALWWWRSHRLEQPARDAVTVASLLIALPILPVLNLSIFFKGEIAHDRYLYLPSIGFAIIVAVAIRRLRLGRTMLFGQPAIQVLAIGVLACALFVGTFSQQVYWASELVLNHHGLSVAPNNKIAKGNFANAISQRGLYEQAIGLFQQLYDQDPEYWLANYNLGYNYYKLGKFEEAENYLARGIEINPIEPKQYLTLAVALFEMQRLDEAERVIRHAIELRPHGHGFHYALGAILKERGSLHEALDEFKAEVAFFPEYQSAHEQISDIESRLRAKT